MMYPKFLIIVFTDFCSCKDHAIPSIENATEQLSRQFSVLISTLAAFDHCNKADQATQENRNSGSFILQVPPLAHSAFQERTTAYLVRTIVCRSALMALQEIRIGAPLPLAK